MFLKCALSLQSQDIIFYYSLPLIASTLPIFCAFIPIITIVIAIPVLFAPIFSLILYGVQLFNYRQLFLLIVVLPFPHTPSILD